MGIAKIFIKIGESINKRFPEKLTTEEVGHFFNEYSQSLKSISLQHSAQETEIRALLARIHNLEILQEDFKKLKEEVNSLRMHTAIKTGMAGTQIQMTPFAQRLSPVQPNGGNKSPQ